MKPGIVDLLIAIAVGASALAVLAMCGVGLIVWLAGRRVSRKAGADWKD